MPTQKQRREMKKVFAKIRKNEEADTVNHPGHYQSKSKIETIDVIEDFELGFHLGNAIKYILRAGKKGNDVLAKEVEDLEKAVWYIGRYLQTQGFELMVSETNVETESLPETEM